MPCSNCNAETIAFAVPADLRAYAPSEAAAATICTRCLTVEAADEGEREPSFDAISNAMPSGDAGVGMALLLRYLHSFATYRTEIRDLVEYVERAGADPMLVVDRLDREPGLDPVVDLARRKRNLDQLV